MKKVHVKGLDTVINGVSIRKMKKWLRQQLASQIRTSIRSRAGRTEAVRQEVESVYEKVKPILPDANLSSSQRLVYDMQSFMGQEYELRFNELRGEVEYRRRDGRCRRSVRLANEYGTRSTGSGACRLGS